MQSFNDLDAEVRAKGTASGRHPGGDGNDLDESIIRGRPSAAGHPARNERMDEDLPQWLDVHGGTQQRDDADEVEERKSSDRMEE